LNNIVRHSGASEVGLKIAVARDCLNISLADNGCGLLSKPTTPGHDGLAGMHRRLQKLGGVCRISGAPGCGTTVEFQLPLSAKETPAASTVPPNATVSSPPVRRLS